MHLSFTQGQPACLLSVFVHTRLPVHPLQSCCNRTIDHVKLAIQDSSQGDITADELMLIFGHKVLESFRTLSEYSIQNGSTLHIVVRPRGC
jgi:Ubiquitin family